MDEFDFLDEFSVLRRKTGEEFAVKELLEKEIEFSIEGVLSAYSNARAYYQLELTSGIISRINIPELKMQYSIPDNYKPFALSLPTAIMGNLEAREHCFPNIFMFDNEQILIGANSHQNSPRGSNFELITTIYFYNDDDVAWKEVLYRSLQDLSQSNYNISLVLLVTSLDMLTRSLLPKNCPGRIDARLAKLKDRVSKANTSTEDFNRYKRKFEKKVIDRRNDFEHEHKQISMKTLHEAYASAFHIIWALSQIPFNPTKDNASNNPTKC